jgi:hypothetical protein
MGNVEIDQETDLATTQLQIRKQLGSVERQQFFNCLDLDNDAVFDKKVDAISGLEVDSLINDRQPDLVFEMHAVDSELIVKTRLIGAFEQSCTQRGVHLHRRGENSFGDRFMEHQVFTSASSASSVVESFGVQAVRR